MYLYNLDQLQLVHFFSMCCDVLTFSSWNEYSYWNENRKTHRVTQWLRALTKRETGQNLR